MKSITCLGAFIFGLAATCGALAGDLSTNAPAASEPAILPDFIALATSPAGGAWLSGCAGNAPDAAPELTAVTLEDSGPAYLNPTTEIACSMVEITVFATALQVNLGAEPSPGQNDSPIQSDLITQLAPEWSAATGAASGGSLAATASPSNGGNDFGAQPQRVVLPEPGPFSLMLAGTACLFLLARRFPRRT